jgi:hypothetical protein
MRVERDIGTTFRELEWKNPMLSGRAVPKAHEPPDLVRVEGLDL